jgi:hypothetical protein
MYVMKVFIVLVIGLLSVMLCLFTPLSAQEQKPAGQPQQAAPPKPAEPAVTGTGSVAFLNQYVEGYQIARTLWSSSRPFPPRTRALPQASGNIDTNEKQTQNSSLTGRAA